MTKFYPLVIKKIQRETAEAVSISFDIPTEWQPIFEHQEGQYLTFRTIIDGEEVRRSYSICSAKEEDLTVAVKKIDGGVFSTFANEKLKKGDVLETMPPMGKFILSTKNNQAKHYVGFAAGSGITPIFAMMKAVVQREPNSRFTLFYGNKNAKSVIFREQIEGLKNKNMEKMRVYHFLSREFQEADIFNGRIDGEKATDICQKLLNVNDIDEVFLCGPEEMILGVKDVFLQKGIAEKNIHFELFATAGSLKKKKEASTEKTDNQVFSDIKVKIDGKIFAFRLAQNTKNILDAAIEQGADLPYACKGGVCCTCKCKLEEGDVQMPINYGLESEEIDNGYVLGCQAFPITESVMLNFDA
jgi:ring-1,2-phenylacetyl-CoA epoxidase subunit PaaE